MDPRIWMSSNRDKRTRASRGLIAAVVSMSALLLASGSALAGQDELKGGSVVIHLQGSRGLKLKPGSLNLPITGGAVDPIDGSGTVKVSAKIKAKRGKGKAKVRITALTLGANGAPGTITAKVGKKSIAAFGTLRGGSVARDGWGAKITDVKASIGGKGAAALNRAFSGKGRGAKKSSGGQVKSGQPLGTVVSVTTDPLSVEVVPGSGSMTLNTNITGAFANKLPAHCISVLAGVTPIAPATQMLANFTFPVSGGSAAPDFSAGELRTAGGQTITKDNGLLTPGACTSADPPVGTKLTSTDLGIDFAQNFLMSSATLPTGTTLRAPLATIDWSTGTRSLDPNTKTLTISGATLNLTVASAFTLNSTFPNESGTTGNDFAGGDTIGTIDLTGAKLR
jgi:hypothetical protein